jgi:site-specific recombinase XerD
VQPAITTEKQPKPRRKKQAWKPPRGIRYEDRLERKTPYYLHWTDGHGERQSTTFESETARENAAKALAEKRAAYGEEVLKFDPREWRTWMQFREAVGANTDPLQVAREWLAARQGIGTAGAESRTVSEAVKEYIRLRKSEEKLTPDTWRHFKTHLETRLCNALGKVQLTALTGADIRKWLTELTHPRTGKPLSNLTKGHHLSDVTTFLDRARREGWIIRNPAEIVMAPEVDEGDVTVISLPDAQKFFEANKDQRVIARVALEAFGGLRYSTVARIKKENINFEDRGIAMPGAIHKSGKRKFRQGHPENLWAWLNLATDKTWEMTPLQYREEKRAAFVRAGLRPLLAENDDDRTQLKGLRNIWRHSFASCHLAAFKNPPLTSYLMQHTRTSTTEIYEGVATETNAKGYFAIKP